LGYLNSPIRSGRAYPERRTVMTPTNVVYLPWSLLLPAVFLVGLATGWVIRDMQAHRDKNEKARRERQERARIKALETQENRGGRITNFLRQDLGGYFNIVGYKAIDKYSRAVDRIRVTCNNEADLILTIDVDMLCTDGGEIRWNPCGPRAIRFRGVEASVDVASLLSHKFLEAVMNHRTHPLVYPLI